MIRLYWSRLAYGRHLSYRLTRRPGAMYGEPWVASVSRHYPREALRRQPRWRVDVRHPDRFPSETWSLAHSTRGAKAWAEREVERRSIELFGHDSVEFIEESK